MEKKQAFHILQIQETKNESEITNAYRTILKQTHPEEDPEGFQKLRLAYETALAYSKEVQQEEEEPKTEVDIWIEQVAEVYEDVYLRRDMTSWNPLFLAEVCEDLDTFCEAREKFLAFCMNHAFLPQEVWQRADQVFQIKESISELSELFPADYLQYVEKRMEEEQFITYDDFEYLVEREETAFGADEYFNCYFKLHDMIESSKEEECLALMKEMEDSGMYHPFFDVERIRFFQKKGEKEEAYRLAEQLMEKYSHLSYVTFYAGEIFFHAGEIERAGELWQQILSKEPDHAMAQVNMTRYYMERKEYQKALDMLEPVLSYNRNSEFLQNLHGEINENLAEELEQRYQKEKGEETCVALANCYRKLGKNQQAFEILKDRKDLENSYQYTYAYGLVLLALKEYEQAKKVLQKGITMQLEEQKNNGNSEEGLAEFSKLYQALYQCAMGVEAYEEAVDICQKAALKMKEYDCTREWLEFQSDKATVYLKMKDYEHTVDVCDEILAVDESYYPAYLHRQQAFYMMKKGQEVIDDFYRAIEIYSGFYRPYQFAAEIFLYYNQPMDARDIMEKAREYEVEFTPFMRLLEIRAIRFGLQNDEELSKIRQLIQELIDQQEAEGFADEECSQEELYLEAGQIEKLAKNYQEALDYFEKVLVLNPHPQQTYVRSLKGWCLYNLERYEEALACYEEEEEECKEIAGYQYEKALCLEALEEKERAVQCFEQEVELGGNIGEACEKLADYYFDYYTDHYHREDYDRAISYITMEIEDSDGWYYYVVRGLYYLRGGDAQLAVSDFTKALEENEKDWFILESLARAYQEINEYDTAVTYYESAITQMEKKEEMTGRVYRRLAKCLKIMRRYEEACDVCKRAIQMDKETQEQSYDTLGDIYQDMGQYELAMKAYKKSGKDEYYYTNLGETALAMGDEGASIAYYEKSKEFYENECDYYRDFGQFCMFHLKDYKMAIPYFEKAVALFEDLDDKCSDLVDEAICYYMTGHKEKARELAVMAVKVQEEYFREINCTKEEYLSYPPRKPSRSLEQAWITLCLGQAEEAKEMFEYISTIHKCTECGYPGCYEAKLYLARVYEAEGNYEKALLFYEESHRLAPSNMESLKGVRAMREKS